MTSLTVLGMKVTGAESRRLDVEAPRRWLAKAWADLLARPHLSLMHGAVFVVIGWGIALGLHGAGLGSLIPAAAAAFFLVAPVLAVAFYEISRGLENGETVTLASSVAGISRRLPVLATMGLILMLLMMLWLQVALLIFMMTFNQAPPPLDDFIGGLIAAPQALAFVVTGTAAGAVIAAVVFAITAVSIPMLVDQDTTVTNAVFTSVAAVRDNWRVMMGWALSIVVLVGIGMLTGGLGLVVTLPLIGHGTWHAYRELVSEDAGALRTK